ncbi:MAG TPA: MFS transporter [Draconibacterium sp.]|nr:MFS transporter [Draconibacterium sp.]
MTKQTSRNPWLWVPSLYFAEGLPYILVMSVAGVMYKVLGISNADNTLYTGLLYLPWVIKPLWSPFVDIIKTKRWWILLMQLIIGVALVGVALVIPTNHFFQYSLTFLWLLAFSSATHDISADGFYMLGLSEHKQAYFIGIRNTFYRVSVWFGTGLLVFMAGKLGDMTGNNAWSWSMTFLAAAILFIALFIWHTIIIPFPVEDFNHKMHSAKQIFSGFGGTFIAFFKKKYIVVSIFFILIFRLGEAQLVKIAPLFMLDSMDKGGLGLSEMQFASVYSTAGIIALTIGGILGGIVIARQGLKKWMLPMVFAMNLPNLVYVFLAFVQPQSLWIITGSVIIEQFGYGFGFTAFMLYLIYISAGDFKTSHYALCTGFMALGMMLPGMISGWIQEQIGYQLFFIWVMISTIPGFIIINYLRYNPKFGMKEK